MTASTIEAHTRVIGSIEADGDLVVLGCIDGSVRAKGQLTLGPAAEITGELAAHDVRIAGKLERAVRADGVIHLLSTAEVRGDLHAARVIIDDGAVFEGQVRLLRSRSVRAPVAAPRVVPELPTVGRRSIQRRQA
ncbi:MAG: polymer-forming cytoskeletal protein [Polyangia bacterium]